MTLNKHDAPHGHIAIAGSACSACAFQFSLCPQSSPGVSHCGPQRADGMLVHFQPIAPHPAPSLSQGA